MKMKLDNEKVKVEGWRTSPDLDQDLDQDRAAAGWVSSCHRLEVRTDSLRPVWIHQLELVVESRE